MGYVGHWLHEHHWSKEDRRMHWAQIANFAKDSWIDLLLITLGLFAVITAVIIAYPALAYLAAKFFS